MWIFGQVWFACVVGFVVGVLLTWLLLARPASRRARDLEGELAWRDEHAESAATRLQALDRDYQPEEAEPVPAGAYSEPYDEPAHGESTRVATTSLFEPAIQTSFETALKDALETVEPEPEPPAGSHQPEQPEEPKPEPAAAERTAIVDLSVGNPESAVLEPEPESAPEPAGPGSEPEPAKTGALFAPINKPSTSDEEFLAYLRAEVSGKGHGTLLPPPLAAEPEPEAESDTELLPESQLPAQPPAHVAAPAADEERVAAERGALVIGDYSDESADMAADTEADIEPVTEVAPPRPAEATAIIPIITDETPAPEETRAPVETAIPVSTPEREPVAEEMAEELTGVLPVIPAEDESAADLTGPVSADLIRALDEARRKLDSATTAASTGGQDEGDDWFATRSGTDIGLADFDTEIDAETKAEAPRESEPAPAMESGPTVSTVIVPPMAPHSPIPAASIGQSIGELSGTEEQHSRSLFEPVIDPDDVSGYVPGQSGHAPLRVRTGVGDDDVRDVHDTHGEDVHTDIHLDIHADIHADTYGETEAGAHAVVPSAVSSHAPSEAFTETIPVVRAEPESTEQESAAPSGSAGAPGWQVGPFGPGSALPLPDGSAPSPQFRVKARTSSMVFHTDASPFYERLEPQVWFRNADDARRAGFTSWERPRTA